MRQSEGSGNIDYLSHTIDRLFNRRESLKFRGSLLLISISKTYLNKIEIKVDMK